MSSETPLQAMPLPEGVTEADLVRARALREFYFQRAHDPALRGTKIPTRVDMLTTEERTRMEAAYDWIENPFLTE